MTKSISIGSNLTLELAPSETPIMSSQDFKILTANTCGTMACGQYQDALRALMANEDPQTILEVEAAAEIGSSILDPLFQHLIEDEGISAEKIQEGREYSTKMTLAHITESARAVSYRVGTTGGICPSGPQEYFRRDGQVSLTVCGEDEDLAQKKSLGLTHHDTDRPTMAEVKVEIQTPPFKRVQP